MIFSFPIKFRCLDNYYLIILLQNLWKVRRLVNYTSNIEGTLNSGKDQFWITHRNKVPENEENSDIATLTRGEVSISPIGPRFLVNDYDQLLKEWINSFN